MHKLAQVEIFLTHILEIPSSNLGMDSDYPDILYFLHCEL